MNPHPTFAPSTALRPAWLRLGYELAGPAFAVLRKSAKALFVRRSADRRLLEDVILAHYARRPAPFAVLSVGTHPKSRPYEALLRGHRYVTVDRDPAMAVHGSTQQHVVGDVEGLREELDAESFDLVLLNGVIGWGLDDPADCDRALRQLHRLLRPGGELIVGWNDRPGRRPFGDVSPKTLPALKLFHRCLFRPLNTTVVCVPGWRRHRYDFFRKPCTDGATRPCVRSSP